ncbi:MAG: hypothetical protein QNJ30_12310 [Kiloniellales bacterium]|nr:hypothetical protein [Kiloniellales bacterium]
MQKVVDIVLGPSLPETGGIARAVTLENGWGQIQTYHQRKKTWVKGGSSLQSLWTAEDLDREMLEEMGYEEEDIQNILWQPGDE